MTPVLNTALELGINTDLSQANSQVAQTKDVKAQIQEQQQIATAVGHVKSAVETYTSNQREVAEQEVRRLKSHLATAESQGNQQAINKLKDELIQAETQVKNWGTGGSTKRAIDAITNAGLIALSGGRTQSVATAAASPYVNQLIKKATEDYPALNIPTHILWGAVEAELTDGNAQTGAISTAAGELGARYLTEHLYGKEAKDLTETERSQIKEMAKALAGVAGGLAAAGQDAGAVKILSESSIGATVANNAVENNYLTADKAKERFDIEKRISLGIATEEDIARRDELNREDREHDQKVIDACHGDITSSACQYEVGLAQKARGTYDAFYPNATWQKYNNILNHDVADINHLLNDKEGYALAFEEQVKAVSRGKQISLDEARALVKAMHYYDLVASGIVASAYTGTKIYSAYRNNKAENIVKTQLPEGVDSGKDLPVVGKTQGYENQFTKISNPHSP